MVPPVWLKLPAIFQTGVDVPLFMLMLALIVQFPPIVKTGVAGLLVLYVIEPVPVEAKSKFPFTVVSNPKRFMLTV